MPAMSINLPWAAWDACPSCPAERGEQCVNLHLLGGGRRVENVHPHQARINQSRGRIALCALGLALHRDDSIAGQEILNLVATLPADDVAAEIKRLSGKLGAVGAGLP